MDREPFTSTSTTRDRSQVAPLNRVLPEAMRDQRGVPGRFAVEQLTHAPRICVRTAPPHVQHPIGARDRRSNRRPSV